SDNDKSSQSTFVKQMKIAHQSGFSQAELEAYRLLVYRNVLDSMHAVLVHMRKLRVVCASPENAVLADKNLTYQRKSRHKESKLHIEAIDAVRKDLAFQKIMNEHAGEFTLMDWCGVRIGSQGYVPNETDILHARKKTYEISEERIHMTDINVRDLPSQRKKWMHCFEGVTSTIFCTALSLHDQVLVEEKTGGYPWL
ncbi:hypothetical protein DXG01_012038, partial [Tephrocybe rancida]